MKKVKVIIHGRVQGVNFRVNFRQIAKSSQVSGYCKNLSSGQEIEAVLCGDPKDVEKVLTWCYTGPELARVDDVEVEPYFGDEVFAVFTIRH